MGIGIGFPEGFILVNALSGGRAGGEQEGGGNGAERGKRAV
jgi:hypothetical protein